MAVTSRNLRTNQESNWSGRRVVRVPARSPRRPVRTVVSVQPAARPVRLINGLLWGTVIILLSLVVGSLNGWIGTRINDLRYGRPRVAHLTARVGHEGEQGLPTEFMAINLNRRVVVLEFPGGDPAQAKTLVGPYLFGAGEDLTPITLDVEDVNADSKPDLLVNIKNEQVVYINDANEFRMISAAEQQALEPPAP